MDDLVSAFIGKARTLRKQYAYHMWTSNGLGTILAGVVCWMIYFANLLIGSGIIDAAFTVGLTLIWMRGKETIQQRFYDIYDEVKEAPKHMRFCFVAAVALTVFIVLDWWAIEIMSGSIMMPSQLLPLILLSFLPVVSMRYLRSPLDFVIGLLLWKICIATSTGQPVELFKHPLEFLVAGLVLVVVGIWDDMESKRIQKDWSTARF